MRQNIFVLGLDDMNLDVLTAMPDAERYRFHQLLTREELQEGGSSVPELLERARHELDAFDGAVDAIVGYWDFPVTMMVAILCEERGLPAAGLEAVVKCEHKYWSRLIQQQVIEEYPAFGLLDLENDHPELPQGLSFPVWIKPIKSASSEGAYLIENEEQLVSTLGAEREDAHLMGDAFDDVLDMLDLLPELADVGGSACLVEEAVTGMQVTVEGYSEGGEIVVYGVMDSVSYPGTASFLRYQYPSVRVPKAVQDRMGSVSRRVIEAMGLQHSTFNIEYFWDPQTDRLTLLEVNARLSQSHAELLTLVDGTPNHAFMVDLSLGCTPRELPRRQGRFNIAGKCFLRRFADGIVTRVPSPEEISKLEAETPGLTIEVSVAEGDRLSEGRGEDSFSYVLAEIFLGADSEAELEREYDRCVEALRFEIEEVEEPSDPAH